jgi:hypothetical protein
MPILQQILLIVCATLSDPVLLNAARIRAGAFTRNNGKLPFWTMMELLMVNRKAQYKFLCEIQNPAWSDPRQQSPLTRPAAAIRH